jgi:hypothetical protein
MRYGYRAIMLAPLVLAGCRASSVLSLRGNDQSFSVPSGVEFTITMQTIGPGEYDSPPAISSPIVAFVDVGPAATNVPAGPTQVFRFRAVGVGQALVAFHNAASGKVVTDTVVVR